MADGGYFLKPIVDDENCPEISATNPIRFRDEVVNDKIIFSDMPPDLTPEQKKECEDFRRKLICLDQIYMRTVRSGKRIDLYLLNSQVGNLVELTGKRSE